MTLWRLCLPLAISAVSVQTARADERPPEVTIATWNLEWFYDENEGDNFSKLSKQLSAPTRKDWDWKRDRVAEVIAAIKPTIIALQEVENRQVLWYLTRRLEEHHKQHYKIAFAQGSDFYTEQDVAFLYHSGLVEYGRREASNEQRRSKKYYNISKHLFAHFVWGAGEKRERLTLLNVHFRAGETSVELRTRQASIAHEWIGDLRRRGVDNIVVLGDFNTWVPYSLNSPQPELATIRGLRNDDSADDLFDLHLFLDKDERATHMIGTQFDRIMVSSTLLENSKRKTGLVFESLRRPKRLVVRGKTDTEHRDRYYKIPEKERDVSDHYPLVAKFRWRD
ncbi:MAG: endonuclease/exonuclease/phosphatase family protein [Pirellulaceae bacterium]|jgi:endonuclease/exonuclease/phosphatase family metal-dependent hydrolase|nr:endonuclease/exonuclease/phosphatase family protein [Pirellulaceae bacterium]MDP7014726.1 endonuclease/exonuclease/phosphatase family protein [Pirellulaceae bacterium]